MKEIIMKILSIIIHGGIHIQGGNRTEHYLFVLILSCLLCSCGDIAYFLPFEGQSHPFLFLKTDTDSIRINCMYFQGSYYLDYSLKDDCIVNYDSLKLQTNDDNLLIYKDLPGKGIHKYNVRKDGCLSIGLGFIRKDKSISVADPLVLSILPSDFITYNGKRITNDTLRVALIFRPKSFYR